jgi:hypothetical protein
MIKNKFYLILLSVYFAVQIIYVVFFPLPFVGDSAIYLSFAQAALREHTYYPNPSCIYDAYLVAPIYINYHIFLLKIFRNTSVILFSNILLNLIQLFLVYKITKKLFSDRVAYAAMIIYILYLNNLGLVLLNLTELPFGVMILASIYFYISPPTITNSLLCGLTAGVAVGIRPTGWALVLAYLIIYVITIFQGKALSSKIMSIGFGVLLFIVPMGLLSKRNIDRFEFTSTTGPANLIMSANPHAKGVFDHYFFNNDSTYKTKKTYFERDRYLLAYSKKYIAEHFGKWISLIPRKIYSTFISDGWGIPMLLHSQKWDWNTYIKGNAEVKEAFQKEPLFFRICFWVLNIWQQLIYGLIASLFLYYLYDFVRGKSFTTEGLLINLFVFGGLAISILFSIGTPRYKYNFLIVGVILISPYVTVFFDKILRLRDQVSRSKELNG